MRGYLRPDEELAALAARQYGVVASTQMLALGFTADAIERRCDAGRLHRLHRGVYAVGQTTLRPEARWMAAVLAGGPGACLSHFSAATLWRIRDGETWKPDITAPNQPRHAGIRGHRGRLAACDRTTHRGIPVTAPARTLIDLSHILDDQDEILRAVRQTQFIRLFDPAAIRDALTRRPSKSIARLVGDIAPTQNRLEDRLLWICDHHRIPRPHTQSRANAHRVDFHWPQQRLIVETDGWEAHGTRHAFQADRTATNGLLLAGFLVLRFTWEDLRDRPAMVARQIRLALDGAAGGGSLRRASPDRIPEALPTGSGE